MPLRGLPDPRLATHGLGMQGARGSAGVLARECEDCHELPHGALYHGLRGSFLANRAQARRWRQGVGCSSRRSSAVADADGATEHGRDADFLGSTSSGVATDLMARLLRASARLATGIPTRIPSAPVGSATNKAAARTSDPSSPSERTSTLRGAHASRRAPRVSRAARSSPSAT